LALHAEPMELHEGLDVLIARRRLGLHQYELAARLGVSSTVVCEIERGRRSISQAMAIRLETALNMAAIEGTSL